MKENCIEKLKEILIETGAEIIFHMDSGNTYVAEIDGMYIESDTFEDLIEKIYHDVL